MCSLSAVTTTGPRQWVGRDRPGGDDTEVRMGTERRVAVITGAAGPAGRAVAAALASDGLAVVLVGSRAARLEAVAAELDLAPGSWIAHEADLREAGAAAGTIAAANAAFGRLDVLVHLVGGWTGGTPLADTPDEELATMLGQHAWTTWHMARAAVPQLIGAGRGRVVAISSPVATDPVAKSAAYAAGKAAQEALLGTLAREVEGTGVTVNWLHVRAIDADAGPGTTSSRAGRTTPGEIAETVRWLCSDAAAAVNGARIPLYRA
jgi:NAD(P)-dependent dehydrogenase (short-subunit alcohol dehydrogenase family)